MFQQELCEERVRLETQIPRGRNTGSEVKFAQCGRFNHGIITVKILRQSFLRFLLFFSTSDFVFCLLLCCRHKLISRKD